MEKKAILVGASGSIGSSLLNQLLESGSYSTVLVLVRKALPLQHPKLKQLVINFDQLNNYAAEIKGDAVFCCLGTTKSQTPDQQQYRKIDYQYPLDVAAIALANGATSYHLVSAMGADKDSSIFYTKTKGEVERDLKLIPFQNIHIYRPSLLDGERKNKRFLEGVLNAVMHLINPLLAGGLKKYRSIKVENVARAMLKQSLEDKKGIFIHQSDQIQQLSID
ncbi:oxidoreductase [Pedobacter sp. L105]|uniref:oxidoreductase n=1 Tax=Pedobacter sp. L105 TaxID=1641871 RepID=UPI00131B20E1|nr:oxidoreductase [Pedobacter sp. L105]